MKTNDGATSAPAPGYAEIEQWLRTAIGELMGVPDDQVDIHTRFARFGIDSAGMVIMTEMLSEWMGMELHPHLLRDHDTIELLSRHLASRATANVP